MTELSPQPVTATQPPGGWALRASGRSRLLLAAVTGAALVAFVAGWALPNVAGPVFVQVRAIATAQKGSVIGASVSIAGAAEVPAGALNVTVELENRYPLAVVLGTSPTAFQAALYRRDSTGKWTLVWHASAGDPALEQVSDSPVGGGSAGGAASVPSGISRHAIADGTSAFPLVDARGLSISPGVYYLRVWGYGVGSPLVAVAVGGATDPSGTPTDMPSAPN